MKVEWEDDFGMLYRKRGQQKYGIRLYALWKIQSGHTEKEVCGWIKRTPKTVRTWRRLYEAEGVNGLLQLKAGRGRKSKGVTAQELSETVETLSAERKGGRIRAQDIVNAIKEKYGIVYSLSGMYHFLKRCHFSWISARSKHPQHNPEAQEAFKKKSRAPHTTGNSG